MSVTEQNFFGYEQRAGHRIQRIVNFACLKKGIVVDFLKPIFQKSARPTNTLKLGLGNSVEPLFFYPLHN